MGIPSAIYLFWHPLDKYCKVCQDNIHLQQLQYQVSTAVPCRLQGMCPPKSESHVGFEQREKRHEKMILKSGWQIKSKKNHWISKIPSPFLFSSLFIVFWNHENVLVLINVHSRGLVSLVSFFDQTCFSKISRLSKLESGTDTTNGVLDKFDNQSWPQVNIEC